MLWGALEPITGPINTPMNYREESEAHNSRYTSPLEMKIAAPFFFLVTEPDDPTGVYTRKTQVFYSLPDEKVPVFPDLLRRMLKYGPRSRATVQEILEHPWFVDSCFDGIAVPVTAKHTLTVLVITLLVIALLVCTLVGLSGSGLNRSEPCCCRTLVINVYGRTGTPPFTHDIDEGDSGQSSKNFKYSQK